MSALDSTLSFPATSCTSTSGCQSDDNIPNLTAGTLSIQTPTASGTTQPPGPWVLSDTNQYPLTLDSGFSDSLQSQGANPPSPPQIAIPIELGGPNTWTIDGDSPVLTGDLSAASDPSTNTPEPLGISFTSNGGSLNLQGTSNEVGQVNIATSGGGGEVAIGSPGSSGDLNGINGQSITLLGGELGGNGTVGPITTTPNDDSQITPGFNGTGSLQTDGATLQAGDTVTFNIADANNNPQLTALPSGTITLGDSKLVISDCQATPPAGTSYTLVSAGTLSGNFGNAPSSGSIIADSCNPNVNYTIDYTSTSVTATVTTIALSPSPPTPATNQPDTLSATVTPASGGTVAFENNGTDISDCGAVQVDPSGTATCPTAFTASSSPESLTASYTPANSASSELTSSPVTMTVTRASTTTAVSATNTSPGENQSVTYTATVSPAYSGSADVSGTVAFSDYGTAISGCTAQPVTQGSSSSTATCTTSYSSAGSHSITASYGGDSNFTGSASQPTTVTVQSPPASTTPPPSPSSSSLPPSTTNPSASPASLPAPTATTHGPSAVGTTFATLNGVIDTKGQTVSWQFQYGESTNYDKATPVQTIAAGKRSPVEVSWPVTDLQPLTVYHYRLVAMTQPSSGHAPVTSDGQDMVFTSEPTGKMVLSVSRLTLKRNAVLVPIKCASKIKCSGRLSITTKAKVGKNKKKLVTLLCNTTSFTIKPTRTKKVKAKIRHACISLLRHAKGHRIKTEFTVQPLTTQFGTIKKVALRL